MCNSHPDPTAQDDGRDYCGSETQETDRDWRSEDGLDDSDVLDSQLPGELQSAFGRFVGKESIDTLREWATEIRRLTGGGSIGIKQLCHTDEETGHWGTVDDERYYFQCFYDAVILAALEERSVDIHTVSPDGTVVEARAVGSDELSVTPADAVFSLGIELDAHERSGGDPTVQDGYAALCAYVKAFLYREAYEQWTETVPTATVALPVTGATNVASVLVA